ncbi:MAG TPA: nitroreductase family deazaflavin-dependent oxidoreductase [Ktedonobacterales bacterium]
MADQMGSAAHVPAHVSYLSPFLKFLMTAGVPLGLNRIVTIRGRKTGIPRAVALAVLEVSGRRWVWAPWGDVNWVRNLRAAGRATITVRRRQEDVTATELDLAQRVAFFSDVVAPFARSLPLGFWFIRVMDGVDLNHPADAAEGGRVFELHPMR